MSEWSSSLISCVHNTKSSLTPSSTHYGEGLNLYSYHLEPCCSTFKVHRASRFIFKSTTSTFSARSSQRLCISSPLFFFSHCGSFSTMSELASRLFVPLPRSFKQTFPSRFFFFYFHIIYIARTMKHFDHLKWRSFYFYFFALSTAFDCIFKQSTFTVFVGESSSSHSCLNSI